MRTLLALLLSIGSLSAQPAITNPFFTAGTLKPTAGGGGGSPNWIIVRTNQSTDTTVSQVMPAQAHGNNVLLLVGIYTVYGNVTVASVTNSGGGTWALCSGSRVNADHSIEWWSTTTSTNHSADVIGYTLSTARGATAFSYEITGQATSTPYETAGTNGTVGTSVTSTSFSPASSGNINVAMFGVYDGFSGAWTAGTDYTLGIVEAAGNHPGTEYRINAPSGAQTASVTFASSRTLVISVVSFKPQL